MTATETMYRAMADAQMRKITPDEYRAIVRAVKAEHGTDGYELAKVKALAALDSPRS